jgi:hypothetical protein
MSYITGSIHTAVGKEISAYTDDIIIAGTECRLIEIEREGKKHMVRECVKQEVKALVAAEYGFEYNSIKPVGVNFYESTDFNEFNFIVHGWRYHVEDYGALETMEA